MNSSIISITLRLLRKLQPSRSKQVGLLWLLKILRGRKISVLTGSFTGLDLNCGTFLSEHALAAIQGGQLKEKDVDKAVRNNLAVLMRLGFFDGDPRKLPYGGLGPDDVCTAANQELAREAARQGIVLLRNDHAQLPLDAAAIASLAVIGPNANATYTMIGNYEGALFFSGDFVDGIDFSAENSNFFATKDENFDLD